jgi:hypothetical protein
MVAEQYRFAGCLIGICIRCGLAQEFNFPLLIWHYFVTGSVEMQHIYEIDTDFRQLVTSLEQAQDGRISEAEFARSFRLTFVVSDWAGNDVPLLPRGGKIPVTLANVSKYLERAKEFRVNELTKHLKEMKHGLCENLGFPIPATVTWQVLQYLACGDKVISLAELRTVTSVRISRDQEDIFWQVVEALTSEERLLLIRFATSRSRLPPAPARTDCFLILDQGEGQDLMPKSSTCFHMLHMPHYTSAAVALRCIRAAITWTRTFGLH